MPEVGPTIYVGAEDDVDEQHRRLDDITKFAALMLETMGEFPKRPMGRIGLRLGARHVPNLCFTRSVQHFRGLR
jgi:hypothetical protein